MANEIIIELAQKHTVNTLKITQGSTIKDVVGDKHCAVGIFGKLRSLEYILQHGDRLELYQPLLIDPKEARRKRVKKTKR